MIEPQVKCDVCTRSKQEANHWFLCFTRPGARGITFGLGIDRNLVPAQRDLVIEHICGQECAHTRLSQFLDSLNPVTERQSV